MKKITVIMLILLVLSGCQRQNNINDTPIPAEDITVSDPVTVSQDTAEGYPVIRAGETATQKSAYIDANGDTAFIPADFTVSPATDETTISSGLVVIGPDESEYVWIPVTETAMGVRDFGSYFSAGSDISMYYDEQNEAYQAMIASVEKYGGFYISRYEASRAQDGRPASVRVKESTTNTLYIQFSPQDATIACEELYKDNDTVQGFFPWGINWDTTLQWLVDSGDKTYAEIARDSTSWGNYSDDDFSLNARGNQTGQFEQTRANNIYDLAGNNWEWTQERSGSSYVMRGGGYNLMGGSCSGASYPAAIRDPLPGNNHHPNVVFRIGLFVK